MGQDTMHDNLILPVEPVGTLGAKPNVDLGIMQATRKKNVRAAQCS